MGLNEIIQVGSRIKELRKNMGITQKEMAERLKIPYSTYSNYENNNREPSTDILEKIACTLGINLFELIGTNMVDELYSKNDFNVKEKNRFLYLQSLGYDIDINFNEPYFTIYHEGYKYTIPYNEPSFHYDLICEVLDSYAEYTLNKLINQYSDTKEKIVKNPERK